MIVQGQGVIDWVSKINETFFASNAVGIGQLIDDELVAGVVYDNYNGNNIVGAITVAKPPTKGFWWAIFHYAFEDLGCKRITAYVESDNEKSLHLLKRLGFEVECTMKDAGAGGGDIVLHRMVKQDCRMLNWRHNNVQKIENTASA